MKKCGCNNNDYTSNNSANSNKSAKSTRSCKNSNDNDCCNTCDMGKFTYVMLGTFLDNGNSGVSGGSYPQIWDINGNEQTSINDLIPNDTYYVVFQEPSYVNLPPSTIWQNDSYAFVWSEQLNITVFGNPTSSNIINEYVALVGYINDRISNLCLPCCVKEKIIMAVTSYVDKQLAPINGENLVGNQLFLQQFTAFCDDDLIPKCGPIYVYHAVASDISAFIEFDSVDVNFVMQFLSMVQFYLRSYYSTKCCCDQSHVIECKCKQQYADVCQFVFGRICVIDIKRNSR